MNNAFADELQKELTTNILPFWMQHAVDHQHDGFYGRIDGSGQVHPRANKGVVLNARILWTFSAAYRLLKTPAYLEMAERAYNYICQYFIDPEHGGVYWEVDYLGRPANTRKQIYAQGFALYGFSEFYRATGRPEALQLSKDFFYLIEQRARDREHGGYLEALQHNWQPIADMRLSEKDANEEKSMNTHLHILEPYTNLLRIWRDATVIEAQRELIDVFVQHIVHPETGHLTLFFDREWHSDYNIVSFGHDIEAAWLLHEAAEILGDAEVLNHVRPVCIKVADAAAEGLSPDGSMMYEREGQHTDRERHWWVQAETVVGMAHTARLTGDRRYLQAAHRCWEYIKAHIIDHEKGEWVWSAFPDGKHNLQQDKIGPWKCPYHNARMCMELMNSQTKELKN